MRTQVYVWICFQEGCSAINKVFIGGPWLGKTFIPACLPAQLVALLSGRFLIFITDLTCEQGTILPGLCLMHCFCPSVTALLINTFSSDLHMARTILGFESLASHGQSNEVFLFCGLGLVVQTVPPFHSHWHDGRAYKYNHSRWLVWKDIWSMDVSR